MDNTSEILALEERLRELKRKQATFDSLPEQCKFADFIHDKMCRHNHQDGCGYHYESWGSPELWREKKIWIDKAERVLAITDIRSAIDIINIIK